MEWISVKDRLPELDGRIFYPALVLRQENPYPTTRLYTSNGWQSKSKVTYWQPLPPPPKE